MIQVRLRLYAHEIRESGGKSHERRVRRLNHAQTRYSIRTACKPPEPHCPLALFVGQEFVVNQARLRLRFLRVRREELGKQGHVVELALVRVREHQVRTRYGVRMTSKGQGVSERSELR